MTRRHQWLAAPALAVLLLGLSACGDDDSSDDTANQDETPTTEAEAEDTQAYCDAALAIETAPEPEIDFESMSPEQQAEAVKSFASETLVPLADEVVATAPAEVEEEVDTLRSAVDGLVETGDFEGVFETPEVQQAEANLHRFDLNSCEWEQVDVRGIDYAYEGLPRELAAGPTSFEFENASTEEEHELGVVRFNEGVTESVEELLQLPQEESESKVTFVGATFAPPGEGDYAVLDLEPGRYGVACFIPVGGGEEGPPHFTEGMFAEFSVS